MPKQNFIAAFYKCVDCTVIKIVCLLDSSCCRTIKQV